MIGIASKATAYALGAALIASLAWGSWNWVAARNVRVEASKALVLKAEAEKALFIREGEIAQARELFEREARQQEQRHASDMNRIEREHNERLRDVQASANRLVADLRAGTVKLQERWRGCVASSGSPQAGGPALGIDAGASDREGSAARIIAAADQCDAQVIGLQGVIRADRGKWPAY